MKDPRRDTHFNALTATAEECERYGEKDRAQRYRDFRWKYYDRYLVTGLHEITDRVLGRASDE